MDDKISGELLEFRLEEIASSFSSSSSMSATMISSSLACQVPMLAKKFISKCMNIVVTFGDFTSSPKKINACNVCGLTCGIDRFDEVCRV